MFVFVVLIFVLVVIVLIKFPRIPTNFPPGPKGIPVLGYLPFLPCSPQPIAAAFPKLLRYGPIVGFFLGPFQPVVVITGIKAVKEALNNEDFDGRPNNKTVRALTHGKRLGIACTDGDFWREQRHFTQRKLKDLILERKTLEDRATSEILDLIEGIKLQILSNVKGVVDFEDVFFIPVINVLWDSLCGLRFHHDDDGKTRKILETASTFNKRVCLANFMLPIPNAIVRLFRLRPEEKICDPAEIIKPVQRLIEETIREHQERRNHSDYSSWDFIDHYLDEVDCKGSGSSFSVEQLAAAIQELFIAGSDTTSNQIGFALIHLINRPDVQRRMQEELDEACGDRLPSLNDRNRLPFTEAVLLECNRLSPVSPATLLHRAVRDTSLQNYSIPKDCLLLIQLKEQNDGAEDWTDPEVFRPERYLEFVDGSCKFVKRETFLPFGAGKRMCLGESMGKAMYFLFVTALVKTFNLECIPDEPPPTLEPCHSMIISYQGFKCLAKLRLLT